MDRRDIALLPDLPATAGSSEAAPEARESYFATDVEAGRQLALGIVHEMNNALGGIAVLSEIYGSTAAGDGDLAEGLRLIHQGAGRLQVLVSHLKILNGPSRGERTYLNLTETVRAQLEMFGPLLPKTLTVETMFAEGEPAVYLDEIVLRRVLLNLLLNLRDGLAGHPEVVGRVRVGVHRRGTTAEVTLSTDQPADFAAAAPSKEARARLDDARRLLTGEGGTIMAYPNGGCVLELPLAS